MRSGPGACANKDHVDPVYLGASYYLGALSVPAVVVVHILDAAISVPITPAGSF